jgi:uncharacterized protein YcfJ
MVTGRTIGLVAVLTAGVMLFACGCETKAQTGAAVGATGGALAGQAIGHNTTGTLIGAGAGALGGYIIGGQMDKNDQKKTQSQTQTAPAATATAPAVSSDVVTVNITNSNGSTTPVVLHKDGTKYIGPKGEQYDHLPTEAELKPVYGF